MSAVIERCRWCGARKEYGSLCQSCHGAPAYAPRTFDQCPNCSKPAATCTCVKVPALPGLLVKRGAIPDEALKALFERKPGETYLLDCLGHVIAIEGHDEPRTWDAVAGMISEAV